MKNKVAIYFVICLAVAICSCEPDVEIPGEDHVDEYSLVYMPQAEGGPKNYTLQINAEPEVFVLGASYGGLDYPSSDVLAHIEASPDLVNQYNSERNTHYVMLPEDAYALSDTEVLIKKGEVTSSTISLSVYTQGVSMQPFIDYMLPVQLTDVTEEYTINEDLQTTYFILRSEPNIDDYPQLDRSDWSVVSFSTEEPAEGSNGGLVSSAFDGQNNTFWHSQWNGGEAPPPHWFVIDMGSTQTLHGLSFLDRQSDNNGKPKDVEVEISMDGENWTPAGNFTLQNTQDLQNQFLTSGFNQEARYFKVTVTSSYNAAYTHLAEIYAF